MQFVFEACLALAACVVPIPPTNVISDGCGAAGLQNLYGQSAEVLATMTFAGPVRIIKPGMVVTMDYSAERLNIDLDRNNHIIRLWCG